MKVLEIYTDGACSVNPGPGGCASVLISGEKKGQYVRGYRLTTNNRMELLSVILSLELLTKKYDEIIVYSDSKYVVDSVEKNWLGNWVSRDWRKSDGKKVLNIDLWKRLLVVIDKYNVKFVWVKGHNGHSQNELCNDLAMNAIKEKELHIDEEYEKQVKQKKNS